MVADAVGVQRFTIQGRLPGLNDILRLRGRGNYAWNSTKKRIEEEICYEIHAAKIAPVGYSHVRFHFWEPNMRRDPDNIDAGKKLILDALVTAGVLPDDGWEYISGISLSYGVDRENPRVDVEIVPAQKKPP